MFKRWFFAKGIYKRMVTFKYKHMKKILFLTYLFVGFILLCSESSTFLPNILGGVMLGAAYLYKDSEFLKDINL